MILAQSEQVAYRALQREKAGPFLTLPSKPSPTKNLNFSLVLIGYRFKVGHSTLDIAQAGK